MPRNTREWAIRKMDMVEGNMNWAITHLAEIVETYHEQHPEIAAPMIEFITAIQLIQKAVVKIRMSI